MSRIRRRPSPAIVVAVMALIAALAGTAIAGPSATTSVSKKKTKKISRQQAKKQISKEFPVDGSQVGSIDEVSETTTIQAGTTGGAEVSCGDKKVIGGGWRDNATPAPANLVLPYEDKRTNNGWMMSGVAVGTRTITVYAYCL